MPPAMPLLIGIDLAISFSRDVAEVLSILIQPGEENMKRMKRVLVQLFVIGAVVAMYVLPVLAEGGGGT